MRLHPAQASVTRIAQETDGVQNMLHRIGGRESKQGTLPAPNMEVENSLFVEENGLPRCHAIKVTIVTIPGSVCGMELV